MTTLYNGGPVMGGTFPALIWASVMSAWEEIQAEQRGRKGGAQEAAEGGRRGVRAGRKRNGSERAGSEYEAAPEAEEANRRRKPKPRPKSKRRRKRPLKPPPKPRPKPAAVGGVTARLKPAGLAPAGGRETKGLPAAQKRQGRSTALVIPIRGPVTTAGPTAAGGSSRKGSRPRSALVVARGRSRAPRSACRGPSRGRRRGASPRRARISSRPAVGSSARISTAAASPSGSATALSRLWMP